VIEIDFNKAKLERFKKIYAKYAQDKDATFIFEGHEFLVNYAKYMIEYLESRLK